MIDFLIKNGAIVTKDGRLTKNILKKSKNKNEEKSENKTHKKKEKKRDQKKNMFRITYTDKDMNQKMLTV